MVSEHLDAGQAGFRVGYRDASQFNREYKRQFGLSRLHGTSADFSACPSLASTS